MKAIVGTFNQEKALVGGFYQEKDLVGVFSVIVKTDCETNGSFAALNTTDTL